MIKIVLTEEDFRRLVAGQTARPRAVNASIDRGQEVEIPIVVGGQEIQIILSDIGWDRISQAIYDAMAKQVRDG